MYRHQLARAHFCITELPGKSPNLKEPSNIVIASNLHWPSNARGVHRTPTSPRALSVLKLWPGDLDRRHGRDPRSSPSSCTPLQSTGRESTHSIIPYAMVPPNKSKFLPHPGYSPPGWLHNMENRFATALAKTRGVSTQFPSFVVCTYVCVFAG